MVDGKSEQKVALVTGASSGMGKDFARALLSEGMVVYAAARRVGQMNDLKQLGAIPLKMDVTNEEDLQAAVRTIAADHGGVDVLINNAGVALFGAMEDFSVAEARYQFDVNLFGAARLTQLVLPGMRKKQAGKIINISSLAGKMHAPLGSWYHASKHALEGWSDCLRLELAQFNIDVVIIAPGAIATEMIATMSEPMIGRSGNGPYGKTAHALASFFRKSFEKNGASPPVVITDLVIKAVRARRPRTRYSAGKHSMLVPFLHRWLSDRTFDKLVMASVK
ncbi:MAG TPA: oxidoreductase [Gallionella sp.]|nr:oxidoreductase [Gallionella sp.]